MRFCFWFVVAVESLNLVHAQGVGSVCLRDTQGQAVAGARLTFQLPLGAKPTYSGSSGCVAVPLGLSPGPSLLHVERPGFLAVDVPAPLPGQQVSVTLAAQPVAQSVTVTAGRGLVGVNDEATSATVLSAETMATEPALALDDRLHPAAGFQLFRRTSSWTANPTTEGVSLRGLGSTAASRTLVESDEVPLNDPFGGWVHWDEIPTLAIADVALVRGGASDLYGSSAIGGVIAIEPVTSDKEATRITADALGATENSVEGDLLVTTSGRHGGLLVAGSGVNTGGYVPTAPALRGQVDATANVAEESGRLELRTPTRASGDTLFLRGNVLNEVRQNGTFLQTNGTRLWRYSGGGDLNAGLTHASLRLFGDREAYRQSFSAISPNRNNEALTRLQAVPTDELGFSITASRTFWNKATGGLGLDLRDIRATDAESPITAGALTSTTAISAHQRELGGYAEGIWQARGWSVAPSVRVDSFRTFDGRQVTSSSASVVREPEVDELVASPHLGLVKHLPGSFALSANAFRAFRGPTMNELYRTGQVGQQTTRANPSLLSERATGFEFGGEFAKLKLRGREFGSLRASYFWTEVNRPVSAVVLTQTATSQTLQRQNLGQIRSRGLSLQGTSRRWHGVDAEAGWQFAVATVTAFNASSTFQQNLLGNWIPEVPRNLETATVNLTRPTLINLHLITSYTGRSFDDAANQFLLHPYARFDLSADRNLWRNLSVYAGAQNLLNRTIDAGKTPILTLAAPRLVEAGLRWSSSR